MLLENHFSLLSHYPLLLVFVGAIIGSEFIALFATIICHKNGISLNLVIGTAICGAVIGNQIWYYIGEKFGNNLLQNHARIKKDTLKFRKWVDEYSAVMALTSRFIYSAGSIIPVLLGVNNYSSTKYLLFNTLGAILWGGVLVKIGFVFGNQSFGYLENPNHLEYILLFFIFLVLIHWWHKHKSIPKNIKNKS